MSLYLFMEEYQKLRKNIVFHDLSENDLDKLLSIAHKIAIEEGDYFIHEGGAGENFYFILTGRVAITKSEEDNDYNIGYLESGDTIGEIALFDHQPRSASAKALTRVELLCFPFVKFEKLIETTPLFERVMLRMAKLVIGRLRTTNVIAVQALNTQIVEYKMRTGLEVVMINIIVALCLFTFIYSWLISMEDDAMASTVISLPLTLGFAFFFLFIMKASKLKLSMFGLTMKNWRNSVREALLFTSILCCIVVLIKWIVIHTTQKYTGHSVFEPFITIVSHQGFYGLTQAEEWLIILFIYTIIITPLQELIVRGGLQAPLEIFLPGKYVTLKAIIISNLIFSTTHLEMSIIMSVGALIAGFYFGWLYSRHHTLIGVTLAHALLGVWVTMVVGF
jgi:hypothetical protein